MKRVMLGVLVALVAQGGATAAWAEGLPWKPADSNTAGDSAAPADLKADLAPSQYDHVVKPIESRLAQAEKAMEPYQKELAKPEAKRQEAVLVRAKERSAACYASAAAAAKKALGLVKTESRKAALRTQYEEPSRQKAIDIYFGLAMRASGKGDLRKAISYYKMILALDPDNADAKAAITQLADQYQQAIKDSKASGSKGGGSETKRPWDREDYSKIGRTTDWARTGQGDW
ncbi:MAG TPA: hypothetical protein VM431_04965 [Phycisphaerae bacterium]|nr:hypothetical protein [Phycisphaerae bacterium]